MRLSGKSAISNLKNLPIPPGRLPPLAMKIKRSLRVWALRLSGKSAISIHKILANIAWAFATLGHEDKALFESLGAETVRKIRDFNPQDIANTAWAFATLGYQNKALFESLGDEAVRKIRDFKPQGLANTAWAFAVMNTLDLPFVNQIGKQMECFKQNLASAFKEKQTHQLLSVWVYASLHFPEDHISWPEWLLNEMAKCSEASKKQAPQSSHLHDQVSIVLNKMNKVFLKEYYFRSYFLDLAFPEDKLCIEVNGPAHYIPGTNRYFGAEILRRKILIKSGWKIATVPYHDWDKLKSEAGSERIFESDNRASFFK